jgi:prepilin-type N-terminal cleavage/methylation domain-containing protein
MNRNTINKVTGFTIVELLVVIVVVGILASLTIVSFTGVSQKASIATISSDLKNAATQIEIDYVNNGAYPLTEESANNGSGLAKSDGTIFSYQIYEDSYCVQATTAGVTTPYRYLSSFGSVEAGNCPKVWKQISSTGNHSCGIASDNKAYCWGYNAYGQIGDNSTTDALVPTAVDTSGVLAGKTLIDIKSGWGHTCALDSDYLLYCWGYNQYGQIGDNSTIDSHVPVQVNIATVLGGRTVSSIGGVGVRHTCIISSDDNAYCWGGNNFGQLGDSSTTPSLVAVSVNTAGVLNGETIIGMSVAGDTNCVVASNDKAYCWGDNGYGQLGNNASGYSTIPVAVYTGGLLSGKTIEMVKNRGATSCAVTSESNIYCWGWNSNGAYGNNSTTSSLVPAATSMSGVLSGKTIQALNTGDATCVIASDNKVYCWGANSSGQLGINSTTRSLLPVAVDDSTVLSGKNIVDVQTGNNFTCALASSGQVYCWGAGSSGLLGNNSTTQSLVPVQVDPIP